MVTHKLLVMQMCGRILVDEGVVAEQALYESLRRWRVVESGWATERHSLSAFSVFSLGLLLHSLLHYSSSSSSSSFVSFRFGALLFQHTYYLRHSIISPLTARISDHTQHTPHL